MFLLFSFFDGATAANGNQNLAYLDHKTRFGLVLNAGHFPAALGTSLACLDTFIHTADLLAIHRACLTDFGADCAKMMRKLRTAELEVGRHLAYLCAVHHQTEVLCFDMLSTGIKTVIHRSLQTDLIAVGTSLYAGLHGTSL
jgi:hypothetical protein